MHGDIGQLQAGTTEGTPPPQLLGATHHGGPGRARLWHPVQVLMGGHSRQPSVHHNFKMVVDAVIQYWVTVEPGEEAVPGDLVEQLVKFLRSSTWTMESSHPHGQAGFRRPCVS